MVCLIFWGVKMSVGSEHKHIFELSEQDGWVDPTDEFVDDQSWKIDKCLQSLYNTMCLAIETENIVTVENGSEFTEQETIRPSSSLLHEQFQSGWAVGICWSIDDEVTLVACTWLVVDIVTQKSIFDQVFIGFPAGWLLLHIDELEESGEWCSSQSFISVHTVATWQCHDEATPSLECLEVCDCLFEFIVLEQRYPVVRPGKWLSLFWFCIDNDLRAASTAVRNSLHMLVELGQAVIARSSSNIKLLNIFWLQVLGNTLEQPFKTINFAIIVVFEGEYEVDLSSSEVGVVLNSPIADAGAEGVEQVAWINV